MLLLQCSLRCFASGRYSNQQASEEWQASEVVLSS